MNVYIINVIIIVRALFFGCILVTLAAGKNVGDFTKVELIIENSDLVQGIAYINQTAQNITGMTLNVTFSETIYNLNGVFIIAVKYGKKFVNYTALEMNYCEGLHMTHSQYMVQMVASGLRHMSNYPLDCPFLKNKLYYVHDFVIDPNIIPSYFPLVAFRSEATFESNKRKLARYITYGRIRKGR